MKKLIAAMLALYAPAALAQSNPGFLNGNVLTGVSLSAAFTAKADAANGVLTTPTLNGKVTFAGVGLAGLAIDASASLAKLGWVDISANNGGTVTWTTSSVSAGNSILNVHGNQSGTIPTSGDYGAFALGIPADTVDTGTNSNFSGMTLSHNWGGVGMTGSRTSLFIQSVQTGAVGSAGAFYDGLNIWMTANNPGNGGNMIAMNPQVNLTSGATGWALAEIMEAQVQSIQPIDGRVGVQMFAGLGHQGSVYDFAYGVTGIPSGVGFLTAFQLGKPSAPWGLDTTNGAIMIATANTTMQLNHGIYLPNVTFLTDSWNDGHVVFGGTGTVNLNAGSALQPTSTAGFVQLPWTGAPPTSAPAGNTNCAIDVSNNYLNCYYAGGWHKIAFSAGAG